MRAVTHINDLNQACKPLKKSDFYDVRAEMNEQGSVIWRFGQQKPVPHEIPILIGEIAHQIRSSLDHILFAIAKPVAGKENRVQMPICETAESFAEAHQRRGRMPGIEVGSDRFRVIESIQPYLRRSRPENWILWQISQINNWDKHRMMAVTGNMVSDNLVEVTSADGYSFKKPADGGMVKSGDKISEIESRDLPREVELDIKAKFQVEPVFGEGIDPSLDGAPFQRIVAQAAKFMLDEVFPRFDQLKRF